MMDNLKLKSIQERESAELKFWKENMFEKPESDSLENIINKMTDCEVFLDIIKNYSETFIRSKKVLEIGGGQGWASCVVKSVYPQLHVTLSDISEDAIKSRSKWEKIFKVTLDRSYACKSYEIPEPDSSEDCIFCFASAHHFADLKKTMLEICRVLKRGGVCFFFHEPTSSRFFYKYAWKRVNKKRPTVPEDVIIYKLLLHQAETAGLKAEIFFNPTIKKRGPFETIYYFFLSKMIFLQGKLPCTANFVFTKP